MSRAAVVALLLVAAPAACAAERQARYAAVLSGGERIDGDRLTGWHTAEERPQLGATPLFGAASPLRWLRCRQRKLGEPPEAYVEFTTGDRLPGVVVDYRTGNEDRWHPLPPHLVVRTTLAFEPPLNKPVPEIRVLTRYVRRIVWQRQAGLAYNPGTALDRDGRSLAFRAARFRRGEMHLLDDTGERRIDWDHLAEIHLPASEPAAVWCEQLAALCPSLGTRLLQIDTSSGLIATASQARFAARFEGNSADPDRWVHGIQPAWSLDILWVPFREIAVYRSFAPTEVPLSQLPPRRVLRHAALLDQRPWQVDRSLLGAPLQNAAHEFGFGLGVAGGDELLFELPPGARSLRTAFCLDRAAGSGGCVRPRVRLKGGSTQTLWEGAVVTGSEQVLDSGTLALGSSKGPQTLSLEVDPLLTGQPRRADPLDIRDFANWCEPLLELDPAAVAQELSHRLEQRFLAWRGWTLNRAEDVERSEVQVVFLNSGSIPGSFEPAIAARGRPLVLRREVTLGPRDKWLIVAATTPRGAGPAPQLEVRIDGQPAVVLEVPSARGDAPEARPLSVALTAQRGDSSRPVSIEIRQLPTEHGRPVQYAAIEIAEQLPTLYQALGPLELPIKIDAGQPIAARFVDRDGSGRPAWELAAGGRYRLQLPAELRVRAKPAWGEVRLVRFAVKKRGGGRVSLELQAAQPRAAPARYDLGQGEPSYGQANRVWHRPLTDDWITITRDLFVDFGDLDVQAIVLGCPDGEAAYISQVDFAISPADFELHPIGNTHAGQTDAPPR